MTVDPIELAAELIRRPSVTPRDAFVLPRRWEEVTCMGRTPAWGDAGVSIRRTNRAAHRRPRVALIRNYTVRSRTSDDAVGGSLRHTSARAYDIRLRRWDRYAAPL